MRTQLLKGGASTPNMGLSMRFSVWRDQHKRQAIDSLQRILKRPLSSSIIILVLAIAILLPTLLYVGLKNIEHWIGYSNNGLEVNVFLHLDTSDLEGNKLTQQLASWPDINTASFISPAEAVKSFSGVAGTANIIQSLGFNPLPPAIKVSLATKDNFTVSAELIVAKIAKLEPVESVAFNVSWFQKAEALLQFGQQLAVGLSALLSLSVALIIGNTIRLAIASRREEIEVSKLVGATNGFVRRPFIYMGVWLGAIGSTIAICITYGCMFALTHLIGPIEKAYNTNISLTNLHFPAVILIVTSCTFLGWIGAWLICNHQIQSLEPE